MSDPNEKTNLRQLNDRIADAGESLTLAAASMAERVRAVRYVVLMPGAVDRYLLGAPGEDKADVLHRARTLHPVAKAFMVMECCPA